MQKMRDDLSRVPALRKDINDRDYEIERLNKRLAEMESELGEEKGRREELADHFYKKIEEEGALFSKIRKLEDTIEKQEASMVEREKTARLEGIKEYRLSKACFERKERYSYPFLRCGFYGARAFLENKRAESYPELVMDQEFSEFKMPDVRVFEPEGPSLYDELIEAQRDELEDLSDPLEPYVPEPPPTPLYSPPAFASSSAQDVFPESGADVSHAEGVAPQEAGSDPFVPPIIPEDHTPLAIVFPPKDSQAGPSTQSSLPSFAFPTSGSSPASLAPTSVPDSSEIIGAVDGLDSSDELEFSLD